MSSQWWGGGGLFFSAISLALSEAIRLNFTRVHLKVQESDMEGRGERTVGKARKKEEWHL